VLSSRRHLWRWCIHSLLAPYLCDCPLQHQRSPKYWQGSHQYWAFDTRCPEVLHVKVSASQIHLDFTALFGGSVQELSNQGLMDFSMRSSDHTTAAQHTLSYISRLSPSKFQSWLMEIRKGYSSLLFPGRISEGCSSGFCPRLCKRDGVLMQKGGRQRRPKGEVRCYASLRACKTWWRKYRNPVARGEPDGEYRSSRKILRVLGGIRWWYLSSRVKRQKLKEDTMSKLQVARKDGILLARESNQIPRIKSWSAIVTLAIQLWLDRG